MTRTIRTAAELDALPVGSVVLDRWGRAWQKHDPEGRDPLWHAAKHHTRRYNTAALIERGPMLVLHDPAAPAPAPSVVPEAAVEAGARAMQAENAPKPDPLNRDQP